MSGLAEFERHLIIARTSEGRKRARAHGVLFGRPRKLTAHHRREPIARRDGGDETMTDIARSDNVSHSTISRLRQGPGVLFLGATSSALGFGQPFGAREANFEALNLKPGSRERAKYILTDVISAGSGGVNQSRGDTP